MLSSCPTCILHLSSSTSLEFPSFHLSSNIEYKEYQNSQRMETQELRYDEEAECTNFKMVSPAMPPRTKEMQATSSSNHSKHIDPIAPIIMIASLILGVGFALGHHFFYNSRDSTSVGNTTQQEWYIRVGTYLAYLVTFTLGVAIATAYTQQFWYSLRSRSVTVEEVDSLFAFLVNVTPFLDIRLWRGNFILVFMAAIKWLALP